MCLQCCTEAEYITEFAPGWHIVRATTDHDEWFAGQYALVRLNDPDFILTVDLGSHDFSYSTYAKFCDDMLCDPQTGHALVESMKQVKYPHAVKRHWVKHDAFFFNEQLYVYLCWKVKTATATTS